MAYQFILYEKRGAIAYVTLNRPEKLNALSLRLQEELVDAMQKAEDDPEVRVVVLKANGRAFSAGYDIAPASPERAEDPYANIRTDIQRMHRIVERWRQIWELSKPVIAQVHGYCLAGGTDLALHCDIIIAAEDAIFGFPPVRSMGSPPTHMWTYLVGPQWAKYLLLTGNPIDGKTAERIGLVWKAVPAHRLEEEVNALASTIAKIPWELLAANKAICNRALELMGRTLLQYLAAETDAIGHQAPIVREFHRLAQEKGLKAALEWRDAPFQDYRGQRPPSPEQRSG
ncbi:MAG: enoyl-CoA hydratase-related protein [Dehalococcoidia bacterium]|nr:enoyl-CoA hydratase-related protein [Dehalococcoidia bacterium]MDW8120203.1 enoyl-CoA hydratase-related protein [Chloroflexota bacterium]